MTSDASELSNMFTGGFGRMVGILTSVGTFISVFIINKTVFLFYLACAILLTYLHSQNFIVLLLSLYWKKPGIASTEKRRPPRRSSGAKTAFF